MHAANGFNVPVFILLSCYLSLPLTHSYTHFCYLFVAGCKQVNDRAVIALALYCPGIEVLNLHSCDVSSHAHCCEHAKREETDGSILFSLCPLTFPRA